MWKTCYFQWARYFCCSFGFTRECCITEMQLWQRQFSHKREVHLWEQGCSSRAKIHTKALNVHTYEAQKDKTNLIFQTHFHCVHSPNAFSVLDFHVALTVSWSSAIKLSQCTNSDWWRDVVSEGRSIPLLWRHTFSSVTFHFMIKLYCTLMNYRVNVML